MTDTRAEFLKESVHWSQPMQLVITDATASERDPVVCEMGNAFAIIGRSNRCQIRLRHHDVSFRHAYLQNFGGHLFCVDLNSREGTLWDGQRRRGGWLTESDGPRIGPYQIRMANPPPETPVGFPQLGNPLDAIGTEISPLGPVTLEFLNRSSIGRTWTINRMLTLVGSGAGCKIRLEDDSISNVHCGLLVTHSGLWVIDFLGRGGTHVDGRSVDYARLETGQILRVGQFGMRVSYLHQHDSSALGEDIQSSTELPIGETSIREMLPEVATLVEGDSALLPPLPPAISAAEFVDAVVAAGVVARQQVDSVVPPERIDGIPTAELTAALVGAGLLTPWQVEQVLSGKVQHLVVSGRFRLLDRLGHGSMGTIFRAHDPHMSRDVAIKFPKSRVLKKPRMLNRFRREALINAKIQHPNIVRAYEIASSGNYIVMEYVPGRNIKQFLREEGAQPPEFVVPIIVQIGEALQFAYRNGVIHRDVKPSNILLTNDGTAKLLDLGLARVDDDPDCETDWGEQETAQMTQAGVQLGTTRYMAPEQAADGHSADVRSDIYSLVCTMYHLLAGVPPFDDENPVKILLMHAQVSAPPIAGIDERLWSIIDKGLAKKPADRFQTPGDLVDRLRDWQAIYAQRQQIEQLQESHSILVVGLRDELRQRIESLNISAAQQKEVMRMITDSLDATTSQLNRQRAEAVD